MKRALPLLLTFVASNAFGQNPPPVPDRQIPPAVLAELAALQNRFETALAADCAAERCFSKGCTYGEHVTADRPRSSALPGLGEEKGPGSVPSQEYLTLARCSFAYEDSLTAKDARALIRRLKTKLSGGWLVVDVATQKLQPIPPELREAPEPPKPPEPPAPPPVAEPPPPEPEKWELAVAVRELWLNLLPHFAWMIAVIMVTFAALILIWAWRRLGRMSPEEEMLLSQMSAAPGPTTIPEPIDAEVVSVPPPADDEDDEVFVTEQRAYWKERLSDDNEPDPDVRALIAQWLKARELGLLAKAVLTFPESFPAAFPDGGEYAESKLEFSDYLRDVDDEELPTEVIFYSQLKQHALSASLARHEDASGMAALRADFGAAGLVRFIKGLQPRFAALLFAHASTSDQLEGARLLSPSQIADLGEQLLQSNRMSRAEANYVVALLAASKSDAEPPPPPPVTEVTDLGTTFDAAGALSVLLPLTDPDERRALFSNAKDRFGGVFPTWYDEIVFPELVLALDDEARANLMLEIDVTNLAGWLSFLPTTSRDAMLTGMPNSLKNAVAASSIFSSRTEQLDRYRRGRLEVAAALKAQLSRRSTSLEGLMS